jgi:hypothetical protein
MRVWYGAIVDPKIPESVLWRVPEGALAVEYRGGVY